MNSKYTREQLRAMALRALRARDIGDPKYLQLVFGLTMQTGINPVEVERRIAELAS